MKRYFVGFSLCLFACSSTPDPEQNAQVSYHRDVRPLIEDQCLECHLPGGIGPFALDSYEALQSVGSLVVDSVKSGRMPPWLPDPTCNSIEGARLMSETQVDLLSRWVESGMPEGAPEDYQANTQRGLTLEALGPPTMTLAPEQAYTPDAERPDDYRCFVLDQRFEQESFMATANIVPDQQALVHHVILYLVPPQFAEQVEALDAAESGEGYTCFGGVGAGSPQPIAGWVPGTPVRAPAENVAVRIPAGARLVMQMHYNTLATSAVADRTEVRLWMQEEQPEMLLESRFFAHLGIDIAAGDANSEHERIFWNTSDEPWTIVATSPHMHLLGKSQRLSHLTEGGDERCLVDIPRWDFNWQQSYVFTDPVIVQPGEQLRLLCSYDNSAANQPVVGGEQQAPQRVTWGEGTLDEMCLNSLAFVRPYAPAPEPETICTDFQGCYDTCRQRPNFPLTGCALECGAQDGCAGCVLTGMITCVTDDCGPQANDMITCFETCARDEDPNGCIGSRCTNSIVGFDLCAAPIVERGTCDSSISACGVSL